MKSIPSGSIVVGVDGSFRSGSAVLWGLDQARLENRALVLVHSVTFTYASAWVDGTGYDAGSLLEACRESAIAELDRAVAMVGEHDQTIEVRRVLTETDPRDALLELSQHAAMVVLGSRGRGPLASMLLGSVSLSVTQHARCPVVILRGTNSASAHGYDSGSGVVVGVDGTVASTSALEFAYRIASVRSTPLLVLHAYWDEQGVGYPSLAPSLDSKRTEDNAVLLAETIAGMAERFPDVQVKVHAEHGTPHAVLLKAAKTAEMVVVGTHPSRALYDLLTDEASRQVAGRAPCTVAVVPDVQQSQQESGAFPPGSNVENSLMLLAINRNT